ncbi:MAG TPA: zinc-ribbon domain-containing protein [Polyangiaceae bacterium]|nr:zinc-ribbon domain-containing protein [Polyangiaceae bacterium]
MKISCQSCHSKYNVADEKVQGKIVKIRCRKCGATIVVNASGGASANGSVPAPAPRAPEGPAAGADGEWHVSVADNDQRTMRLAQLVDAYNAGIVAQDTFIWTEGMSDWKPLSEVDAVVSALHAAVEQAAAPATAAGHDFGVSAPVAPPPAYEAEARAPAAAYARAPAYEGGFAAQAEASPAPEPRRAAVVKREARARDLFATRSGEELHTSPPATDVSAPLGGDDSRLTGQRNENSVLFSLDHLTKNAEPQRAQDAGFARTKDDSGLIDLKALSAKAESMRPPAFHDANALSTPLGMAPPLGFAAPLGAPLGGFGPGPEAPPRSKLPLLVGAGAGVALLLVLGIVIGLKIGGAASPTAVAAATVAPVLPVSSAATEPAPSASASAGATPQASASASAAPVAAKPRVFAGGSAFKQGAPAKPAGGAGAPGGAGGGASASAGATGGSAAGGSAAGGAAAGGGASPAPAKKGDCGCNGDLMCMMKCSTH